ncbi:hypothetical protein BOX15_Mlig005419g1, partial [Macrostomum lignano]
AAAMTLAYVKNTIGLTVSDEELENIPHPSLELYTHTTYRGVQFGIFVSMAMVAPVVTAIRGPRNFSGLAARALRFGRVGALAGLPLGPAMTIGMTRVTPMWPCTIGPTACATTSIRSARTGSASPAPRPEPQSAASTAPYAASWPASCWAPSTTRPWRRRTRRRQNMRR